MKSTDIPAWLGVLLCIVASGIVVAMGKWGARRERARGEIKMKNKE
jgi:hypothetical protein